MIGNLNRRQQRILDAYLKDVGRRTARLLQDAEAAGIAPYDFFLAVAYMKAKEAAWLALLNPRCAWALGAILTVLLRVAPTSLREAVTELSEREGYDLEAEDIGALERACRSGAVLIDRLHDGEASLLEILDGSLGQVAEPGEDLAPFRPIPMVLHCPCCGRQHVDAPEPASGWENPPHKSHLCHGCGAIWRPADRPTVGVAAIETRGKSDSWPPHDTNEPGGK